MKCTITKEVLLEPLTSLDRVAGKHSSMPILQCILLSVEGGLLSLRATNLEVGRERYVPCTASGDGSIAVSGAVLVSIVSALPSGAQIQLMSDGKSVTVEAAGSSARLTVEDPTDFPTLPKVADGTEATVDAGSLVTALTSVAYTASTSTIKPELSSIFLRYEGTDLIAAATDSFRLAEKRLILKTPVSLEPILVPARNATEMVRALERVSGPVKLRVNEHQLSLLSEGSYFTTRLVSGTFPDYTQIIPKEFATEATLLVFDVEQSLRKASVFSDKFNQTTLTFSPKQKLFSVHTESAAVGEVTDKLSAALTGEELTISFNQRYLLDVFQSIKTDSVTFSVKGPGQPMVIRGVGDSSFRYLVMPMNK